jgi:hypothetical protein
LLLTVNAAASSRLDPTLTLLGPEGSSVAYNDDYNGLGGRIAYTVRTSGRHVAVVAGYAGSGAPGYAYELTIEALPPAPGDPTTLYATGCQAPWAMAAAGDGTLLVVSRAPPGRCRR